MNNKFYYPYGVWGDIGISVAIIENVYLEDNNRYNISLYQAYVDSENGITNLLEVWKVHLYIV